MTPGELAEKYLRAHKDYVDALKALLGDLDLAFKRGERARCDLLCDAMIEMQRTKRQEGEGQERRSPDEAPPAARAEK